MLGPGGGQSHKEGKGAQKVNFPFWLLFISVIVADQLAKIFAIYHLFHPIPQQLCWLRLELVLNDGAAWSLLAGHRFFLIAVAMAAFCGGIFWKKRLGFPSIFSQLALALLGGGIVGNAIDRLFRGHVVDFICVTLPFYRWPAFNIADIAICWGIFLLIARDIGKGEKRHGPTANR
jgi:signal peptidase II